MQRSMAQRGNKSFFMLCVLLVLVPKVFTAEVVSLVAGAVGIEFHFKIHKVRGGASQCALEL